MSEQQQQTTLDALVHLSARLGRDPLLTQGAGGNTSVKTGAALWVKASGKWLARADSEPMFVPVDLAGVRRRIAAGEADPVSAEVMEAPGVQGLRPSIETTLHALMPQPVVLHVHSVNTMAWAVRSDGQQALARRLEGLQWAWVPYRRPGLPLTQAVAGILQSRDPDILVIANHGLVVGGADCAAAAALLDEVEERLRIEPRPAPPAALDRLRALTGDTGYRLPRSPVGHALATDPLSLDIATGGSLYPDHVVFLGVGATVLGADQGIAALTARYQARGLEAPPLLLVPGAGVVVRESLSAGGEAMVECLARVVARVPEGAPVVYLNDEQNAELLNWDAEQYRRSLAVR